MITKLPYGTLITHKITKVDGKFRLKDNTGKLLPNTYKNRKEAEEYRRWNDAMYRRVGDIGGHKPGQD